MVEVKPDWMSQSAYIKSQNSSKPALSRTKSILALYSGFLSDFILETISHSLSSWLPMMDSSTLAKCSPPRQISATLLLSHAWLTSTLELLDVIFRHFLAELRFCESLKSLWYTHHQQRKIRCVTPKTNLCQFSEDQTQCAVISASRFLAIRLSKSSSQLNDGLRTAWESITLCASASNERHCLEDVKLSTYFLTKENVVVLPIFRECEAFLQTPIFVCFCEDPEERNLNTLWIDSFALGHTSWRPWKWIYGSICVDVSHVQRKDDKSVEDTLQSLCSRLRCLMCDHHR